MLTHRCHRTRGASSRTTCHLPPTWGDASGSRLDEGQDIAEDLTSDCEEPRLLRGIGIEAKTPLNLTKGGMSQEDPRPRLSGSLKQAAPQHFSDLRTVIRIEQQRGEVEASVTLACSSERDVPVDDAGDRGAVGEDVGVAEVEVDDVCGDARSVSAAISDGPDLSEHDGALGASSHGGVQAVSVASVVEGAKEPVGPRRVGEKTLSGLQIVEPEELGSEPQQKVLSG